MFCLLVSDYEPTVYEVEVPLLSRSLCNKWLQNRDLNISPGMICAGYEHGGKDACQVSIYLLSVNCLNV